MSLPPWILLAGLALALLVPGPAGRAEAATCRLDGVGQWGPITTYTGSDDCGGVLSPGDHFIIDGDVEVVADLVQSGAANARIEVEGGSLYVAVGNEPRNLVLGSRGLICWAPSDCRFEGGFRLPQGGAVLPDFDSASFWSFGAPIPCPGWDESESLWQPDCGGSLGDPGDLPGSPKVFGGHETGPPDASHEAALDAIAPGEVWYFTDPDPGDPDAPPDAGFHFDVVAAAGAAGRYVHLEASQGSYDNGYPQARRITLACALAAPVERGEREVFLTPGCLAADFDRDGHWLRFERNGVPFAACPGSAAAPCQAESRVFRIQSSENDVACPGGGTCDRLLLADVRGLDRRHASGGIVWIGVVGAGEGDAGLMLVPVRIRSVTPGVNQESQEDSRVEFAGESHVRGVVFDQTGDVLLRGSGIGVFEDVFLREPTSAGQIALNFWGVDSEVTLRRVTLIGGESFELAGTGGGGNDHGINFTDPSGDLEATLEDVSVRYTWDDLLATSAGSPPAELTVRRARTQYGGFTEQSQSGLQVQSDDTDVEIEDFECIDCSDSERPLAINGLPEGSVRRLLFLAPKSDVVVTFDGVVEQLTAIGARDDVGTWLSGNRLESCVIRENVSLVPGRMMSGSSIEVSRCLFQANGVGLDFVAPSPGGSELTIEDTVFLDNFDNQGSVNELLDCTLQSGPLASCRIERTTVAISPAWQGDPASFTVGIRAAGATDGREVTLRENVLRGFATGLSVTSPAETTLERLCFEENGVDAPAAHLLEVVDPHFGPLGLRDPDAGGLDPLPGGAADQHPCGIPAPAPAVGICERGWLHAVNGLEPECMAPACANGADDDYDGLRDFPEDPDCVDAQDDSERPACDDGIDNDGDGLVDLADPGCPHAGAGPEDPACDDGIDNDGDGLIDFADPNCGPAWPYKESGSACGVGPSLALLLPLLLAARRRSAAARPIA